MPRKKRIGSAQTGRLKKTARSRDSEVPTQQFLSDLVALYKSGKVPDAESQARLMTEKFPDHPLAWQILGSILKETNRYAENLFVSQKLASLAPNDARARYNLANSLTKLERFSEAIVNYREAILLNPDFFEAHYNLANQLKASKKFDEAVAHYRKAITLRPNNADAHNNLGLSLCYLGRLTEGEASYRRSIKINNSFAEAHHNLSLVLKEQGRIEEAQEQAERALLIEPNRAETYVSLGIIHRALRQLENAETCLKRAIELSPDSALAHNNLANTFLDMGKLEEAKACYEKAIESKCDYAEAHRHLSKVKKYVEKDSQFFLMQELNSDKKLSDEKRCHINFGLAKAYEDFGDFEKAYKHYVMGNSLRRELLGYDHSYEIARFERIKLKARKILGISLGDFELSLDLIPVFIVGMPRSGTTLVEQIISAHSKVSGAGELPYVEQLGSLLAYGSSEINSQTILDFRIQYLDKIRRLGDGYPLVTDKMPHNFRFLGLIATAFPEAKIIHVKRDPAAVCWANYTQFFESKKLDYCYSTDDIVAYYQLYEDLSNFYFEDLGESIFVVDYEKLTLDPEREIPRLIDYLGLEWEDACLAPEKNVRGIATASAAQVREKIYKGSSQQWKQYQPYLNGALDEIIAGHGR